MKVKITASFVALTVIFCLAVGILAFQIHKNRQLVRDGKQAHDALCIFSADLARRHDEGQKLLDENQGDPIFVFGLKIPRATLVTNVDNQRRTLESLNLLDCIPAPKVNP